VPPSPGLGPQAPTLRFRVRSLIVDIGPLRRHPEFRRLWFGLTVSSIGSQLTVVGVAYQAYVLTDSSLIVGLVSLVQLVPMLVGSLGGGAMADAVDRRKVLILAQIMLALCSGALALNASLPHPALWVLFVATSASAIFQGLDYPTRLAVVPMILPAKT
jgi:MFS family permease